MISHTVVAGLTSGTPATSVTHTLFYNLRRLSNPRCPTGNYHSRNRNWSCLVCLVVLFTATGVCWFTLAVFDKIKQEYNSELHLKKKPLVRVERWFSLRVVKDSPGPCFATVTETQTQTHSHAKALIFSFLSIPGPPAVLDNVHTLQLYFIVNVSIFRLAVYLFFVYGTSGESRLLPVVAKPL